jgi:hypothetical protein
MPLSLNEIRDRAVAFSKEWMNEASEEAEAKSFWDGFFNVFGISRRRVAIFEKRVNKRDNQQGYVDLLWKGVILIEHKSRGHDLEKAYKQAKDYFPGIKDSELPRYILVCDFARFRLYDLEEGWQREFKLNKLVDNIHLFGFISGYTRHVYKEQDPVNIKAAELMGRLHDQLKEIGYTGHPLEVYLVRLLFCLFADDTGIFDEKGMFQEYIELHTATDGSDLASRLASLFEVLDQPKENRLKNLSETLYAFPYVNGKLFVERLPMASFDARMRQILLDCCYLDWSQISPAIFGSLFQSVMDEKERRNLGAHYTSEKNILKLIKPLFLDELTQEFEEAKKVRAKLDEFHIKLSTLRFLDPACGCGNFLIIAYRELRLLEIEVLKAKFRNQMATHIEAYVNVNVDQFYGIEYEEFPAQIAQVAMWLIDHQMNQLVSEAFSEYYARLPLVKSATIAQGNALRIDWSSLTESKDKQYNYILGNPPFVGSKFMTAEQRHDITSLFGNINGSGILDYVTGWFVLAAKYLQNNTTKAAFVSTNSISQGEQVGVLWGELLHKYHLKIHFAHRTFDWSNEARGNAGVHVIITGFACFDSNSKSIFEYPNIKGEAHEVKVKNINPYLIDGKDILIKKRSGPICNVPRIEKGNQPTDGGFLLLTKEEKELLIKQEPNVVPYIKKFLGGQEFIQGIERFCLWLVDIEPSLLRKMPKVIERLEGVKKMREVSTDPKTREMAKTPWLFRETINYDSFVAIPEVSSERRYYIPIGFLDRNYIPSNKLQILPNGNLWQFGILTSLMHMAWTKYTCGRLESRLQYSASIVYNNFPWPENPSEKNVKVVEDAAQGVLNARAQYPDSSLADLYDPNTMPATLVKAHNTLDKAVDLCYRANAFQSEAKRIEFLFELYDKYTAGLFAVKKKTTTRTAD